MMKRKSLFYFIVFGIVAIIAGACFNETVVRLNDFYPTKVADSKYGAFLAAQHAIYVNDFDAANKLIDSVGDVNYDAVTHSRDLIAFLAGNLTPGAASLGDNKDSTSQIIYDAYLAQNENWDALYNRHKAKKSVVYAPFRIWAAIGKNRKTETLKYIDSLESNDSWKSFVRGQIYAEYKDPKLAAQEFAKVGIDFMNINDYLYIMSFYDVHNMHDAAEKLRQDFSSNPGGMFMADFDEIPDWTMFSGIKNALAFNLIQNVSHTQIMLYSDLSVLMLRFAQIVGPDDAFFNDAINYYIGQFFANTHGNYRSRFNKIASNSPFYLFAKMRMVEEDGSVDDIKDILQKQPLFIPALNKLVAIYTRAGNKSGALRVINNALKNERLYDNGKSYLIKRRAMVNLVFGDIKSAQADIHAVAKTFGKDAEILAIQARIWATQEREIENAYDYAMMLIKKDPMDVFAWDTLAMVVLVREGNDAALHILEKIGSAAKNCSSLFEHLGDAYVRVGNKNLAQKAYLRALDIPDDGLSIASKIHKKLRKLK